MTVTEIAVKACESAFCNCQELCPARLSDGGHDLSVVGFEHEEIS